MSLSHGFWTKESTLNDSAQKTTEMLGFYLSEISLEPDTSGVLFEKLSSWEHH